MKINKINRYLLPASLCLLATLSCTKLQTNVYSVIPVTSYWQTPAEVAAGVAPAYSNINSLSQIGGDFANMIEGVTDEMVVPTRGNDWGDAGHWNALWFHSYEPTNTNWDNGWKDVFGGISKCNLIITAVNGLSPAPSTLPSILAQVKTIRAYYYYQAMSIFGNVPIVTDTTTSSTPATQSRKNVYNFIISDLTSSLPNLTSEVSSNTYGQVTKYFAFALLARLYLNQIVFTGTPGPVFTAGDNTNAYTNAINYCDSVMAGPYSLMTDYFDNFMPSNGPGSTENIFAFACDHINNKSNDWENSILHYQSYLAFGMSTGNNLWNGFCSQADFYNTFDTASTYSVSGSNTLRSYSDQRSGQWLIGQQFIGTYNYPPYQNVIVAGPVANYVKDAGTGANLAFNPNFTLFSDASPAGRLAGIRNIKYFPAASSGQNGQDMDNDFVIFRLAEIYLIKAEAELRSGSNPADALALVNMLRARAYGSSSHALATLDLPTLLAEKGREMAYEGVRRDDLIRYEVTDGLKYFTGPRTVGSKAQDPDDHWMVFPIPALEITANANLQQNPGY